MKTRTTWLAALSAWSLAAAAVSMQSSEAPPRVATRDDAFVQRVAADVLADVALGRLAAQRATRPEVKEFARTLADEQSRAYEDLKALAWGDPDVKTWAARLLPTLKQRLARARELAAPATLVLER